jgi:hypothetical protein
MSPPAPLFAVWGFSRHHEHERPTLHKPAHTEWITAVKREASYFEAVISYLFMCLVFAAHLCSWCVLSKKRKHIESEPKKLGSFIKPSTIRSFLTIISSIRNDRYTNSDPIHLIFLK